MNFLREWSGEWSLHIFFPSFLCKTSSTTLTWAFGLIHSLRHWPHPTPTREWCSSRCVACSGFWFGPIREHGKKKISLFFLENKCKSFQISSQFSVCSCNFGECFCRCIYTSLLQTQAIFFFYHFIIHILWLKMKHLANRNTNYWSSRVNLFSWPKGKSKDLKLLIFTGHEFFSQDQEALF